MQQIKTHKHRRRCRYTAMRKHLPSSFYHICQAYMFLIINQISLLNKDDLSKHKIQFLNTVFKVMNRP